MGIPWLRVNPNYKKINAKEALTDQKSVFYMYKRLIDLRRKHDIIVWGDYELVEETPEHIFAYSRTYEDQRWFVTCNMSSEKQVFTVSREALRVIASNYPLKQLPDGKVELRPYKAFMVEVGQRKVYLTETYYREVVIYFLSQLLFLKTKQRGRSLLRVF